MAKLLPLLVLCMLAVTGCSDKNTQQVTAAIEAAKGDPRVEQLDKADRKGNMTDHTLDPKHKRRNEVLQAFKDYPGKISPAIQEKFWLNKLCLV
jgi:hypothetical protein